MTLSGERTNANGDAELEIICLFDFLEYSEICKALCHFL